MSEAAEYKHWPDGEKQVPKPELDPQMLANLSKTTAEVSERVFDDPVVRILGRDLVELPIQTVEAIEAVEAATDIELSKIGHDLPAFERKPLGDQQYRYTLRLPYTDEFDAVSDVEYVFHEGEKTLTKQRTTKPAQPTMMVEHITIRDELASLHRQKGEIETQLTELVGGYELPAELREEWDALLLQRERVALLGEELKQAFSGAEDDFGAFGNAAQEKQKAEDEYQSMYGELLRKLYELGDTKGDDGLASLAKGVLILDSLIKISQQRQDKLFTELDAAEEASRTVEVEAATASNSIAEEFMRVLKALESQELSE